MSGTVNGPAPRTEIAVTGLGLLTPAGIGAEATWDGVCAGTGLARPDPRLENCPVDFSCALPPWDPEPQLGRRLLQRLDQPARMAVAAAREAVASAGLSPTSWNPLRVGVVIGAGSSSFERVPAAYDKLTAGRPHLVPPGSLPRSLPSSPAVEVALDLGIQGETFAPAAACASGALAIATAERMLRAGVVDIALAGGAESACSAFSSVCFSQLGALSEGRHDPAGACRPFDRDRDGFVLGEGAAVLVLERLTDARRRHAPLRAVLAGSGTANDAHNVTAPHPEGRGLQLALRTALHTARWEPADVHHVNAHGTGTRLNDLAEARALAAVFPRVPPVTATKSVLGHAMGASGAIEAALTVLTLHHQQIPPTANHTTPDPDLTLDIVTKSPRPTPLHTAISTSSAFGGLNVALAFRTPHP